MIALILNFRPYASLAAWSLLIGLAPFFGLRRVNPWMRWIMVVVLFIVALVPAFLYEIATASSYPRLGSDEFTASPRLALQFFDSPLQHGPNYRDWSSGDIDLPNHLESVKDAVRLDLSYPSVISVDFGSPITVSTTSSSGLYHLSETIELTGDSACRIVSAPASRDAAVRTWRVGASRAGTCDVSLTFPNLRQAVERFENPWQMQVRFRGQLATEDVRDEESRRRNVRDAPFRRAITLNPDRPILDLEEESISILPGPPKVLLHLRSSPYDRLSEGAERSLSGAAILLSCLFGSGGGWFALSGIRQGLRSMREKGSVRGGMPR